MGKPGFPIPLPQQLIFTLGGTRSPSGGEWSPRRLLPARGGGAVGVAPGRLAAAGGKRGMRGGEASPHSSIAYVLLFEQYCGQVRPYAGTAAYAARAAHRRDENNSWEGVALPPGGGMGKPGFPIPLRGGGVGKPGFSTSLAEGLCSC